jgi:hypothetical protein
MAQCANCRATIIFGGHRLGDYRFCSSRCLMEARPTLMAEGSADVGGGKDELSQLREDLITLAEDVHQLLTAQEGVQERVDFLERALFQLREEVRAASARQPKQS